MMIIIRCFLVDNLAVHSVVFLVRKYFLGKNVLLDKKMFFLYFFRNTLGKPSTNLGVGG